MTAPRRRWLVAVALGAAVVAAAVGVRGRGISAARPPSALEARAALATWQFLVPAPARTAPNPVADTDAVRMEAAEHWADHCAVCHASDGRGSTTLSRHMFPPVPDFRSPRIQGLTDGELFYAIEQGMPWTGMPAWTTGTDEGARESWALVRFIRHVPALTAEEIAQIEALMPRSPADLKREREIEEFLKPAPSTGRGRSAR
jgi:mono/diheme cytochrome c family protein